MMTQEEYKKVRNEAQKEIVESFWKMSIEGFKMFQGRPINDAYKHMGIGR